MKQHEPVQTNIALDYIVGLDDEPRSFRATEHLTAV